jgi:hypothetical protein
MKRLLAGRDYLSAGALRAVQAAGRRGLSQFEGRDDLNDDLRKFCARVRAEFLLDVSIPESAVDNTIVLLRDSVAGRAGELVTLDAVLKARIP